MTPLDAPYLAEVKKLIAEGKLIEAIKIYRQGTGVGLKEAKDAVEALRKTGVISSSSFLIPATALTPKSSPALIAALKARNKIEAIKIYRELTGLGLKESKDVIDQAFASGQLSREQMQPIIVQAHETKALKAETQQEIITLLQTGQKIEALKVLREATGLGLKEAQDEVENLAKFLTSSNPTSPSLNANLIPPLGNPARSAPTFGVFPTTHEQVGSLHGCGYAALLLVVLGLLALALMFFISK